MSCSMTTVEYITILGAYQCTDITMGGTTEYPDGDELEVVTYMGDAQSLWQFSAVRTVDEIIITQARGPSPDYEPFVTKHTIEQVAIAGEPIVMEETICRKIWSQRTGTQSQRSDGRFIEILYRDRDGWHIDRPSTDLPTSRSRFEFHGFDPTDYPGIEVASGRLTSTEQSVHRYLESNRYRFGEAVHDAFEELLILAYDEVNEESMDHNEWYVENPTAYSVGP